MTEGQTEQRLLSIGEQVVQQKRKKRTQARNKRIKIHIALEESGRDEKMTDGQEISFKDIREGHRHAVSKCQRGEEWRR